jgi:hypothetical protein
MVRLNPESAVNHAEYPKSYKWDSAVRRNYSMYQEEIDKLSYHLQRVQRYILVVIDIKAGTQIPAFSAAQRSQTKPSTKETNAWRN